MKIAVVAANGKAGKLIVEEAVNRGMDVTAIVRGENKTVAPNAITKDLFDLTSEDLSGFDAVVDAFGNWTPEAIDLIPTATVHMAKVLSGSDARLLVVGGAGSLYVDPEHTKTVVDVTPFPEAAMPVVCTCSDVIAMSSFSKGLGWWWRLQACLCLSLAI